MAKIKGINTKIGEPTSAVAKTSADSVGAAPVSSGIVTMLAQANIPSGWLLCDGAEYDQSTYSALYSVIGSAYNTHPTLGAATAGKFRVPDLRDVFPIAMNPSANVTTLGSYSTTGWNHTHTVPAHAHTLGNHTHTLGSHTHSVAAHSHTLNSHTHSIPDHSHAIYGHIHYFAGHCHSGSVSTTASHYHQLDVTSDTNTGSGANRVSNTNSGNMGLSTTGGFTVGFSGTIGSSNLADNGFNTDWYSYNEANSTVASSGAATGGPSASSGNSAIFNSGTPSAASGAPSSNTTSADGSATTGTANPPYFGVHFIIKA